MAAIVTRDKLYPPVARRGPAWQWVYSYSIDGAPAVTYGAGIASLRRMLKEKFGIAKSDIIEEWSN